MTTKQNEADIIIDRKTTYQTIDGFGASLSGAWHELYFHENITAADHETVMDLLFTGKGLALSLARVNIGPYSPSQGTQPYWIHSHEPEPGQWVWTNDAAQVWALQAAYSRFPALQTLACPWSPPYWMKDNGQVRGGGRLRDDMYDSYGDYLATYVKKYRALHNITIDHLSLQNESMAEPKWAACRYSHEEMLRLIRLVSKRFADEGLRTKLQAAERTKLVGVQESTDVIAAHPDAWDAIAIVNGHCYGRDQTPANMLLVDTYGKPFWMTERTEHGHDLRAALSLAERLHRMLSVQNATAYFYWLAVDFPFKDAIGGPEALIGADATGRYAPNRKFYAMANFSRFIRPGYIRIAATTAHGTPDLLVSSYYDPESGRVVAVVVNTTSSNMHRTFSGLVGSRVEAYRTSDSESLACLGLCEVTNGSVRVAIPPGSITTLVELG